MALTFDRAWAMNEPSCPRCGLRLAQPSQHDQALDQYLLVLTTPQSVTCPTVIGVDADDQPRRCGWTGDVTFARFV